MNCDGVRDLLSAYLDGELSAGELLRVEQHLRRCHACADEVDSLRQTTALVASLEEVELPAMFHAQLHERLVALGPPAAAVRRASHASVRQRQQRRWAVPAAAAAAVFAIGLTAYSSLTPNQPDAGGLEAVAMFDQSLAGDKSNPKPDVAMTTPDPGKTDPTNPLPTTGKTDVNGQTPVTTPQDNGSKTPPVTTPPVFDPRLGQQGGTGAPHAAMPSTPTTPAPATDVWQYAATASVVKDDAKIAALHDLSVVKQAFDGGIKYTVPAEAFNATVARVKEIFPDAQVTYQSQNVGPDVALANNTLLQLNAEREQMLKQPRAEQQDQAQLQLLEERIKTVEADKELLLKQASTATVTLTFQTAAQ